MTNKITATEVPERSRLSFYPYLFGERAMMRGEALLFSWAEALSNDYRGGLWTFYHLSNGGAYAAPRGDLERLRVFMTGNGYEGEMSNDAFGVVCSMFALNHLMSEITDEALLDTLIVRYQTRHTYGSMMISTGENPSWVSRQMGHCDTTVTLKSYARWMPVDTESIGARAIAAFAPSSRKLASVRNAG
ncbi:antirestriction protein [Paraburkholderia sp. BL10I2N1]|uniref:antirestriction protein n=1 Tax=Paraburkholderia sp. BL10I2N1 TaxID=1938796 RepID=UPI00105F87BE|nr:antirestriction protein [Paraburkholderia sp. BL10I2N1]TDN69255.1 antirestriction protein [Paraburkholderia sp. BL10I2N1]